MERRRVARVVALLVALPWAVGVARDAVADGPTPPPGPAASTTIAWQPTLVAAFEAAAREKKPIFVAINAERVDGKSRLEPAAKELRENTYSDPAVVKKSREFVCALVKPDAGSADYAELRGRFSIDGVVVSPQHIFAHADGTLISRKEYWSHAPGAPSVEALVQLMDEALAAHHAKAGLAGGGTGTPEEQRARWIAERIEKIRSGTPAERDAALAELVAGDKKGDCLGPLVAVLAEPKRDTESKVAIVRRLGKPGLEGAVAALVPMLDDTSDEVRANAAVSLEYIGSAAAVEPLTKRLPKERDELVRNDCCRALGRCGAKQEAVRKTLLRELATAKTNKSAAGPAIGLSYFEKDAEAARGIEKIVAPGLEWQKRAFALWALTMIRDPKSAQFVSEKIAKTEKNQVQSLFVVSVARVLAGQDADGDAQRAVSGGVQSAVSTIGDIGGDARRGRDQSGFAPNGEFEAPRGRGR